MKHPAQPQAMRQERVVCFPGGAGLRRRSVSPMVLAGKVDVPPLPGRLTADCEREIMSTLALEPGDVEALSLVRARARWPQYRRYAGAVSDWTAMLGLHDVLDGCDTALMACRGARYHHDAETYGHAAFCNLFLSEDKGLDLHFPGVGYRMPLARGTVVIFDTAQPHAVIARTAADFSPTDFQPGLDCSLLFLTWELPIENINLARALQIELDVAAFAPDPGVHRLP